MTYDAHGLVCIENFIGAAGTVVPKVYGYATNDDKATVEGAGYFNLEVARLAVGDRINVSGDLDGTAFLSDYLVTSNDGTTVGITAATLGTSATAAEIDAVAKLSTKFIAAGATLAVTAALHNGKIIKLDTAAGSICTLPAATGSGATFRFAVSVIATSNSHIVKVANSSDTMVGIIQTMSDDPATMKGFLASGSSDTITLNRTTTGSTALGEFIEITDFAANLWLVRGVTASTGTEATPFSATV